MPAVSQAQFRAMQVARHNPKALYERNKGLASMSQSQLGDFTSQSPKGLPKKKESQKSEYTLNKKV